LVQKLGCEKGIGIVLLGSFDEKNQTDFIESQYNGSSPLWNLAGKTNLDDMRRVVPKLSQIVSNDSSPIHLASAFNIPTLALFGPTVPTMGFSPLADGSHSMQTEEKLDCRPCSEHGPQQCPMGHFKCMKSLSPEIVFERMTRVNPP